MTRRPIGRAPARQRARLVEKLYRHDVLENAEWDAWAESAKKDLENDTTCPECCQGRLVRDDDEGLMVCDECEADFVDDTKG